LAAGAADVDAWAQRLAKLAGAEHRFRTGPHQVGKLLEDPRVVRGGHSATNLSGNLLADTGAAEVWVLAEDVLPVQRKYGLLAASSVNVVTNVPAVPGLTGLGIDGDNAYRLVVVGGLARSRDTRTRAAARALLEQTLKDGRWQLRAAAGVPSRSSPRPH